MHGANSDPDAVRALFRQWPDANIGVACGKVSGIFVIDVDAGKGGYQSIAAYERDVLGASLPPTLTAISGGGGNHYVYAYPTDGLPIGNRVNWLPGVDVRSDGGYVIAAPSLHISGGVYAWKDREHPVASAPSEVHHDIRQRVADQSTVGGGYELSDATRILDGVEEGQRDDTLFRWACRLRQQHESDADGGRAVVTALVLQAARNSGFPEREALIKVEQAFKQDHSEDKGLARWAEWATALMIAESNEGRSRLNLRTASQLRDKPARKWLIESVLPEGALFQIFGQTGEYKSFIVLDMAASIANGVPWLGYATHAPGLVALVLGEGGSDADQRMDAWLAGHPGCSDQLVLYSVEEQLDLLSAEDVRGIGEDLLAYRDEHHPDEQWRLIVFDTQADHMPSGDEDKAKDFTVVKRAIQRLSQATGASVGLVHHTGWDTSRERGSSRQRQALDVVMHIDRGRVLNIKQKFGAKFDPIRFNMAEAAGTLYPVIATPELDLKTGVEAVLKASELVRTVLSFIRANPTISVTKLKKDLAIGNDKWVEARDYADVNGYLQVSGDGSPGKKQGLSLTPSGIAWLDAPPG